MIAINATVEESQREDVGTGFADRYVRRDAECVIERLNQEIGALKHMIAGRDELISRRERELLRTHSRVVWLEQQVRKLGDMLQLAEEEIENGYLN